MFWDDRDNIGPLVFYGANGYLKDAHIEAEEMTQ